MNAETVFASPTPNTEFGSKKNSDDQEKDVRKEEAREFTPVSSANPKAWFAPGVAPPPPPPSGALGRARGERATRRIKASSAGQLLSLASWKSSPHLLNAGRMRVPARAQWLTGRPSGCGSLGGFGRKRPCLGASSRSRPEKENERGVEALPAAGRGDHPSAARPPSSGPQRPPKRGPKHWKYRRAPVPFYNFENYVIFI